MTQRLQKARAKKKKDKKKGKNVINGRKAQIFGGAGYSALKHLFK